MNCLNSLLLEGNVLDKPAELQTDSGRTGCEFFVESIRRVKTGPEKYIEEKYVFFVEAWGKMAESCAAHARAGRGVRIVGRLAQGFWKDNEGSILEVPKVYVVADHIEFKPCYDGLMTKEEDE